MFKGNIFLAGENIFAKVCQHLAFGGLETTLSKFEHRLLPTTDAKLSRILAQKQKYEYLPESHKRVFLYVSQNEPLLGQSS